MPSYSVSKKKLRRTETLPGQTAMQFEGYRKVPSAHRERIKMNSIKVISTKSREVTFKTRISEENLFFS